MYNVLCIPTTKKYMKKLLKITEMGAWRWKDLNYTSVFFSHKVSHSLQYEYHVHNCLTMSAPAGNQHACVHYTVSNW